MTKKTISLLILACLVYLPFASHAFMDPFATETNNTPGQAKKVTKAEACALPDWSYDHWDTSLTDIKRPLSSGETLQNHGGFYKHDNFLYYWVSVINSKWQFVDGWMFSYDCQNKTSKDLGTIKNIWPEAKGELVINVIEATSKYIEFLMVPYAVWLTRDQTPYVLNLQTSEYSLLSLTVDNIKNLNEFLIWYKPIIHAYKSYFEKKTLVNEVMWWYDIMKYWDILDDDNGTTIYNKLFDITSDIILDPIKIHDIDDNGNWYISIQPSFYVCSQTALEECQDEKNLTHIRLPMITAPINILTRTIDISKMYKSIDMDEISWLYTNWLTKYNDLNEFRPWSYFTREQAAKFFSQYATKIKKLIPNTDADCGFFDLDTADSTLKQDIVTSCQLGIFKWSKGFFYPKKHISHEEAATVLVRIIFGMQDESMQPWYTKNVDIAKTNWLIINDGISFDISKPIERGEIWQMLYSAKNK